MVLVDTSVLIGYLKGAEGKPIGALGAAIDQGIAFGICPMVYPGDPARREGSEGIRQAQGIPGLSAIL
jgi:hypothetical protein